MRIERIEIEGFGPLADASFERLARHDVIVVHGPNEAGKSSLREFITTMLYGFDPATRDAHPAARDGDDLAGSLTIDADGHELVLRRQLKSKVSGSLQRGDEREKLDNRPISEVAWLSRETFRGLHSLDLDELARIDASAWQAVEQRLLGGAAVSFLRPGHEAVRELDERAGALWRADRRGKPEAAVLSQRLSTLRASRREAAQAADQLDRATAELAAARARLAAGRTRASQLELERTRHERFAPALRSRREVERLRGEADELASSEVVERAGDDPAARLAQLRDELATAAADCAQIELESTAEREHAEPSERDATLVAHASEIRGLTAQIERDLDDRRRLETETERATEKAIVADDLALRTFGRSLEAGDPEALAGVDLAATRAAIVRAERAAAVFAERTARPMPAAAIWAVMIAAVALVVGGAVAPTLPLRAAGIGAGLVLALAGLQLARARDRAHRVRVASEERAAARRDLEGALAGLPISPARLADPDGTLAGDIEALRAAAREATRARAIRDELVHAIGEREGARAVVQAKLGSSDVATLAHELELAERRMLRREAAISRLDELDRRLRERAAAHEQLADRLQLLQATVLEASPVGDEADGLARVRAAQAKRIAADEREKTIPADVLDEARELTAGGATVALSDEQLAAVVADLAGLRDENEQLAGSEADLAARCSQLADQPGVADIDGELGAVEERLTAIKRERDRLALLSRIVSAAEHEVRDRYAPAFVQTAGRYLAAITAGRYHSLSLAETTDGAPRLEVLCGDSAFPTPVGHPLSRGTIEQIYVALRLALVDEVDADVRLPLFLDEVLVNWDPRRVDALVALLGSLERRQVFVSTCHPELADQLERRLGARVLELPGPDGALLERATTRRRAIALVRPPGVLPAAEAGPTLLDILDG